LARRC
jgi:hypothetical protein